MNRMKLFFDRGNLGEPYVKAKRVLDKVDSYIELTGKTSGTLHVADHYWDVLNNALHRGTDGSMDLSVASYREFTLIRHTV